MIKNTRLDGSVIVGRHLSAGGNASVSGSVSVGHDLRVSGWLDAPNLKRDSKGLFLTPEALNKAYPFPEPGWWALVGITLPADLYVESEGRWVATGAKAGDVTVDTPSLTALAEEIALQTASAAQAAARADAAADKFAEVAAAVSDTAGEALETADEARLVAGAAAIMPFDGVYVPRPGQRPQYGVWYVPPRQGEQARFLFVSSDYGFGDSDYHDADAAAGESPVRSDCLFRQDGTLWHFDGRQLVRLADAPQEVASAEEFGRLESAGATRPGRLYCVVDSSTRRVTDLFMGA